jgi:hypothetical protein
LPSVEVCADPDGMQDGLVQVENHDQFSLVDCITVDLM